MLNALISLIAEGEEVVAQVMEAGGSDAAEQTTQDSGSPWNGLIMMVAIIAIFYFLLIRPQQKKQKEIKKARESMQVGDRVITAGGIHGKITNIKDDAFTISIAPEVNIKVDKGSVYPAGTSAADVAASK